MDWDKLRIFHLVAKAGTFTSAASILNLSQSSVSRQIIGLENDLGVMLFHRHPRGLVLTEQGEILQKTADDVFKQLYRVEGQLQDTRKLAQGPLVITVSDFIASTWLAPRIKSFKDQFPDIQLTVLIDDRPLNIGMREADIGIRLHKPKDTELIQRKMTDINMHICGSKDYLDANGRPKTIEELKNHCLIAFPEGAHTPFPRPNWLFEIAGVDIEDDHNLIMMNSMHSIHTLIRAGTGIAVLPDYLIHSDETLEQILPKHERPSIPMYFVYAQARKNSSRINSFRDFMLQTVHETPF